MAIPRPNTAPAAARQTTWHNPMDYPIRLQLLGHAQRMEFYEVEAGGDLILPAEYDRGVQVRKNGVVVQGQAPQLIKVGAPPAKIHPALDVEAQKRREADEKAYAARAREDRAAMQANAAEEVVRLATAREEKYAAQRAKAEEAEAAKAEAAEQSRMNRQASAVPMAEPKPEQPEQPEQPKAEEPKARGSKPKGGRGQRAKD